MKRKKRRHQEKAKSKAKAKAKGKPKAASTRRKQKEKKETKDTKEKNEEEDAPKRENLNDKCEKLRAAVGDAETQQDQQDVSEEEGELRDRGKARKFLKLKDAGPIPDHILAMFEHESQRSKTSQDHIRLHLLTGFSSLMLKEAMNPVFLQASSWIQRLTWCFRQEDNMSVRRTLAQSCCRGIRGPQVTAKMVAKMRIALHEE